MPFKLLRRGGAVQTPLSLSPEAYRWIFDSAGEGLLVIERGGWILEANPRGQVMLGYSPEELSALPLSEVVEECDRAAFQESLDALGREGQARCEVALRRKEGTSFPAEIEATAIKRGLRLVTVRDLTEKRRLEDAAQASEGKYRQVIEQVPSAILIFDAVTEQIREANRAAVRWLGYSHEELLSLKITDLVAADPESIRGNIERVLERGSLRLAGRPYRRKDSSLREAEVTASAISCGENRHILAILFDTEESRALLEESVLRSERESLVGRIGCLINASRDMGTVLKTAVTEIARTLRVDRCFVFSLDRAGSGILVEHEYLNPDLTDSPLFIGGRSFAPMETVLEAHRHHEILWSTPAHTSAALKPWWETLSGEYGIRSFLSVPIHLQDEGYFGAFNLARCVSPREWAPEEVSFVQSMVDQLAIAIQNARRHEALRTERDKMTAILANIGMGLCAMDRERNIIFMSGQLIEEYGMRVGEKCYNVFDHGDRSQCKNCGVEHILEKGKDHYLYTHSTLEDWQQGFDIGSQSLPLLSEVYEVSCSPIFIRGERCVLEVTRNITAQEQWRQAQKMEAVWTLAGGIAHDFNNLLTGILGYASLMLQEMPQEDPHFSRIEMIAQSAQQAADLVSQLLVFSRSASIQTRPVSPHDIIAETVPLLRRSMGASIDLQVRICPEAAWIEADPIQIQHLLINLATNARDAMPEGGSLVLETRNILLSDEECRDYPEARPGRFVQLSVTDTGVGIPPEHLPRIFEPFFTTKKQGQGTGLGLANVYHTVKKCGGFLQAGSVPGHTRFDIFLPVTDSPSEQIVPLVPPEMPVRPKTATVLAVDDEPIVLEFVQDALTMLGYRALTATGGEEAIEIFRAMRAEIDLVLLDLNMPRMGGRECYRHLAFLEPGVKVIFSTGYDAKGLPEDLVDAGSVGFLHKPYRIETLEERIAEFLANRPEPAD